MSRILYLEGYVDRANAHTSASQAHPTMVGDGIAKQIAADATAEKSNLQIWMQNKKFKNKQAT